VTEMSFMFLSASAVFVEEILAIVHEWLTSPIPETVDI